MLVFANILFKFLIFYTHFPTFCQQNTQPAHNHAQHGRDAIIRVRPQMTKNQYVTTLFKPKTNQRDGSSML